MNLKNQTAFIMLDVVLVVFISSLILSSIMVLLVQSMLVIVQAGCNTEAAYLAQGKVAEIRQDKALESGNEIRILNKHSYNIYWDKELVESYSSTTLRQITVRIEWQIDNREKMLELVSYTTTGLNESPKW